MALLMIDVASSSKNPGCQPEGERLQDCYWQVACRGEPSGFSNVKMPRSFILFAPFKTQVILFDVESAAVKLSEWKQEL